MLSMIRRRKLTIAAGAVGVAILVAGLGAAGAIAGSRILSSNDESKAVIDDAAAQLGVEPAELSDALKQALKNRIDEAVEDGRLSEERADELKDRIDASEYPRLRLFGRGHHGGLGRGGFMYFGLLDEAASFLGMTSAELREALRDQTLAEIADEQAKTPKALVDHLVATQTKRIDEAVEDGRLTQEQATELESELRDRTQDLVDGELRRRGDGERRRFWHGPNSPRGPPPPFGGPTG
jgi:polyhydroxyalkanoate synthesis regulator phasin